MNRQKFIAAFKRRSSLRLHMALILFATSMAGVLASKAMLLAGIHNVAIRYPVTVLFAYMVFFAAIKTWLWLTLDTPADSEKSRGDNILSGIDVPLTSGTSINTGFSGGGGSFNGGGASGGFDDAAGEITASSADSLDGVGDVVGGAAEDDVGLVVVLVLGLLAVVLFSVLGVGIFLIWQAPAILAEACFDAVLATSLARSAKRMKEPDWVGSVLRSTWKPFAIVFALATAVGFAMHHYTPKAVRMMDVINMLL